MNAFRFPQLNDLTARNVFWDYVHQALEWLYEEPDVHSTLDGFRPGDIACCQAAVEAVLEETLGRGIRDEKSQIYRFCVVNRHIEGDKYEIFVMSTFGNSKSSVQLSSIAQDLGVPVNLTNYNGTIPALKTTPPILFGIKQPSFVFALPAIRTVFKTKKSRHVRLVPGELGRLVEYSEHKVKVRLHPSMLTLVSFI